MGFKVISKRCEKTSQSQTAVLSHLDSRTKATEAGKIYEEIFSPHVVIFLPLNRLRLLGTSKAMGDNRYTEINWNRLLKRLSACAAKWFLQEECLHREDVLPATAMSAVELTNNIVSEFIKGRIKWDQSTGEEGLFRVIRVAMKRDFLDLVKTGRAYKKTDVLDVFSREGDTIEGHRKAPVLENLPDPTDSGFYCMDAAFTSAVIYPLIGNDIELKEFVDAVLYCGCLKREDIATVLGVSPQEVTNRQRRLRLALAPWYSRVQASSKPTGH